MEQDSSETKDDLIYGIVEEMLPNAQYRVRLEPTTEEAEGELVLGYLSGKMRRYKIRVLVGDKVGMVPNPYGGQTRITKRL